MPDNRLEMFQEIKKLLKKYEPPMMAMSDLENRYELVSKKQVVIDGRNKPGICFASVVIQSSYVGFYLMSVYGSAEMTKKIPAELMKTLKGKTCFHIKTLDATLKKQIADALQLSLDFYKKQGWV